MNVRFAVVSALALLLAPLPVTAQDAKDREIQELRKRLSQVEDDAIERARSHDMERRRLQLEKQALQDEVAKLRKENALLKAKLAQRGDEATKREGEDAEAHPILDGRKLILNFHETPLAEVVGFLREITGMNLALRSSVPEGAEVTLSVKDVTLRRVLDLLCETARTSDGAALPLDWRLKSGAIQIAKKKTKD